MTISRAQERLRYAPLHCILQEAQYVNNSMSDTYVDVLYDNYKYMIHIYNFDELPFEHVYLERKEPWVKRVFFWIIKKPKDLQYLITHEMSK